VGERVTIITSLSQLEAYFAGFCGLQWLTSVCLWMRLLDATGVTEAIHICAALLVLVKSLLSLLGLLPLVLGQQARQARKVNEADEAT
jgi:hypothetical protein